MIDRATLFVVEQALGEPAPDDDALGHRVASCKLERKRVFDLVGLTLLLGDLLIEGD